MMTDSAKKNDDRALREQAVAFARMALNVGYRQRGREIPVKLLEALEVAERYAHGEVTDRELKEANHWAYQIAKEAFDALHEPVIKGKKGHLRPAAHAACAVEWATSVFSPKVAARYSASSLALAIVDSVDIYDRLKAEEKKTKFKDDEQKMAARELAIDVAISITNRIVLELIEFFLNFD